MITETSTRPSCRLRPVGAAAVHGPGRLTWQRDGRAFEVPRESGLKGCRGIADRRAVRFRRSTSTPAAGAPTRPEGGSTARSTVILTMAGVVLAFWLMARFALPDGPLRIGLAGFMKVLPAAL